MFPVKHFPANRAPGEDLRNLACGPSDVPSHAMVKCGDQVPAEVPGNCRLKPQTRRHVHRSFLQKFRGARTVAQFSLHMAVGPRPKVIRRIKNVRINRLAPLVLGSNPKGRYRLGASSPALVLWVPHRAAPASSALRLAHGPSLRRCGHQMWILVRTTRIPLYFE